MVARIELDEALLAERYGAGESVLALAGYFGVDRMTIRKRLVQLGVPVRGMSEAGAVRSAQMSPEERKAQATPSHIAARGRVESDEKLARAAVTRYVNQSHQRSAGEVEFEGWLRQLGCVPEVELPEGRYNIDLALRPFAIEVLGGKWHGYKASHKRRTAALMSAGWHVVFVWNTSGWPISVDAAQAVARLAGPPDLPGPRRYWVLRGDGALIAEDEGFDLDRLPSANSLSTRRRPA